MAKDAFKEGYNKGYKEGVKKALASIAEEVIQRDIIDRYSVIVSECLKDGDIVTLLDGKFTLVVKDGKLQI